jgi:hypothetical protein
MNLGNGRQANPVGGSGFRRTPTVLNRIPSKAIDKLQGLMLRVPEDDEAELYAVFSLPAIFGQPSGQHVEAVISSSKFLFIVS